MQCVQCKENFDHIPAEIEAYKMFDAVLSDSCPDCRHRRHLIFRNERNLFNTKSFLSGKNIISLYPKTTKHRIIDSEEWWSDRFDATMYGHEFDFNRPFFDQIKELKKEVPRWSKICLNVENSEFSNNSANVKDSYLAFSSCDGEQMHYCMRVIKSSFCIDCMNVNDSQYCSNSLDIKKCYGVHYSGSSESCNDSYFVFDCKNCADCILCAQLRNKKYCILNKELSKEEYEKKKKEFLASIGQNMNIAKQKFEEIKRLVLYKNLRITKSEDSIGDFISSSKNAINCYSVSDLQDCTNSYDCYACKNCHDNLANDKSELCLEVDTAYDMYNCKLCTYSVSERDCAYTDQCMMNKNLFGCVGLKHQQYCILNKKYSKEDYEEMLKKIKLHMQKTGEWGKPFPATLTPFPYNITVAQEYYPLTKDQALAQGFEWYEEEEQIAPAEKYKIPYNVEEADESICKKVLVCEETGKLYNIIPQELRFYKQMKLPLPRISPHQRYMELLKMLPPKRLRDTVCSACNAQIKTVYPADAWRKIVCNECYLKKVY
ncbi:MAG: hypothetical protein UT33_C0014G0021 [Candidatus Peregrinibacteria bacterium GW2011_GWC2_39_14]|nr:MAG: hypothetical protein US92_C0008G0021 [Candidatus Peregrinibacteria bacterium GW2011_GWA2_38_36]KKR05023.1 MAG: hypothetical protein UT33_C0014G0021 [Candidatus Peregrinibacteria bacterium GW2011_GWC2_39_14]